MQYHQTTYPLEPGEGQGAAAAPVVGVLHTDERCLGGVDVGAVPQLGHHLLQAPRAVRQVGYRRHLHAC